MCGQYVSIHLFALGKELHVMTNNTAPPRVRFNLSEDWVSTLIGLVVVLVIGSGLIGPGPQSEKVSADVGKTIQENVKAVDGWSLSAKQGDVSLPIHNPVTDLDGGQRVMYICADGVLEVSESVDLPPDEFPGPDDDHAQVILMNYCAETVTLTLKTDYVIRWPAFGLFE
jgi:hypothetical protein